MALAPTTTDAHVARREKLARVQAQIGRLEARMMQEQAEWDWDRAEEVRWQTAKRVL